MAKRIKRMKLCECGCGGYAKPGNRFINRHFFRGVSMKGSENPFFGKKHTEKSRKSMSVSQKKRFENEEERAKYSAMAKARKKPPKPPKPRVLCKCGCGELANPGRSFIIGHHTKGKNLTDSHRANISKALSGENHPMYGKNHTDISRAKMRKARLGKELPDEIRANMSKAQSGKNNNFFGWTHTGETREKLSMYCGPLAANWRGGISAEPYCIVWIDPVFKDYIKERDGYKCQNPSCRKNSTRLCIHHINYDKKDCIPKNLITLCTSCNSRANFDREFWQKHYEDIMERRYSDE